MHLRSYVTDMAGSKKIETEMGTMRGKIITVVGASLLVMGGLSSRAVAGSSGVAAQTVPAGQKAATLNSLEEPRTEALQDHQLSGGRGSLLIDYKEKQSVLDSLIKRLQNGEPVTPDEIDHAREQ